MKKTKQQTQNPKVIREYSFFVRGKKVTLGEVAPPPPEELAKIMRIERRK